MSNNDTLKNLEEKRNCRQQIKKTKLLIFGCYLHFSFSCQDNFLRLNNNVLETYLTQGKNSLEIITKLKINDFKFTLEIENQIRIT